MILVPRRRAERHRRHTCWCRRGRLFGSASTSKLLSLHEIRLLYRTTQPLSSLPISDKMHVGPYGTWPNRHTVSKVMSGAN